MSAGSSVAVAVPNTITSLSFIRPTMSKFSMVLICGSGTGGLSTKYCEPRSPCSSPLNVTKMMERFGFSMLKSRASSRTAAVPDALSSAPLRIASLASGSSAETVDRPR